MIHLSLNLLPTFSFHPYLSHNHQNFFFVKVINSVRSGRCFSSLICFSLFDWARIYMTLLPTYLDSANSLKGFSWSQEILNFLRKRDHVNWRTTVCGTFFQKWFWFVTIVGLITKIPLYSKKEISMFRNLNSTNIW